jgi:hypothetical protein
MGVRGSKDETSIGDASRYIPKRGKGAVTMLTYWFPTPLSFWWPLAFAIGFALVGAIMVSVTLARRAEEPNAGTIALLYGLGFGLVAVSEFLMYLNAAFGWSLATVWAIPTGFVIFTVIAAAVIAVVAIGAAILLQIWGQRSYRVVHPIR